MADSDCYWWDGTMGNGGFSFLFHLAPIILHSAMGNEQACLCTVMQKGRDETVLLSSHKQKGGKKEIKQESIVSGWTRWGCIVTHSFHVIYLWRVWTQYRAIANSNTTSQLNLLSKTVKHTSLKKNLMFLSLLHMWITQSTVVVNCCNTSERHIGV